MLSRSSTAQPEAKVLKLHLRERVPATGAKEEGAYKIVEKTVEWDPKRTALIVCDMWDDHWCQGAARRVAEMAGPMNQLIAAERKRGVLIIHAPSTTVDFYKDTPQRKRAQTAPYAKPPVELSTSPRWGTAWCWPDAKREPELPIDDSDMGCDCADKCTIREAWTREIAAIDIGEPDAITDNGQEVYNLLRQHDIDHVMILGVHLNMCVLGRPFGIRQLKYLGQDVVLVRDMTDTMYNHEKRPMVDHFSGTDLVIEHIEKHWCPTISSTDLTGGKPFRFREDKRP
jgi:nicotinamidase-related amidase